jgi:hypothetical protein
VTVRALIAGMMVLLQAGRRPGTRTADGWEGANIRYALNFGHSHKPCPSSKRRHWLCCELAQAAGPAGFAGLLSWLHPSAPTQWVPT